MTKLSLENWKNDNKLDGLLFFAQSVEKMVSRFTIDSYKAPVLNTNSLCYEISDVLEEIYEGFLHERSVDPIVEELIWSLDTDPVAKKILGYRYFSFVKELKEAQSSKVLKSIIDPLRIIIDRHYFDEIKSQLVDSINPDKNGKIQKSLIYDLAKIYISELVYCGYSQEYIHQITMQIFFSSQKIENLDQIYVFFEKFSFENEKFDVFFKCDESFSNLSNFGEIYEFKIIIPPIEPRKGFAEEKAFFKIDVNYPLYILFKNFEAIDPFDAQQQCEQILYHLKSLSAYSIHKRQLTWYSKSIVYSTNDFFNIVQDFSPIYKIKDSDISDIEKNINEINSLFANLNEKSRYFILNSLNLHSIAVESNSTETQLMNLWTALETLLPPPENQKRILHFLHSFEPFLGRKYVQKLLVDLLYDLRFELDDDLDEVLDKVQIKGTQFEKLSAIVALQKENEPLRELLYTKIGRNLRLRFKIFNLMKSLHSADSIYKTIDVHNKRIKWQLQRIYRVRNLIVHKGEKLEYIKQLVENLHSYYHTIISLANEVKNDNPDLESLDMIFKFVRIEHDAHLGMLRNLKNQECMGDNFKLLLFGSMIENK